MKSKVNQSGLLLIAVILVFLCGCQDERRMNYEKLPAEEIFSNPQQLELLRAAQAGDLDRIDALLGSRLDINEPGKGGMTVLLRSLTEKPNKEGYARLLERGADPNVVMVNGQSVMNQAAEASDPYWISKAIEHGGNVDLLNEGNPYGFERTTPLHFAIWRRNTTVAKLLVDKGADVNHASKSGWTPALQALRTRNFELALFLLERGANLDAKSSEPGTVLDFIRSRNNEFNRDFRARTPGENEWFEKIVKLLESRGIDMTPPPLPSKPPKIKQVHHRIRSGPSTRNRAMPFFHAAQSPHSHPRNRDGISLKRAFLPTFYRQRVAIRSSDL